MQMTYGRRGRPRSHMGTWAAAAGAAAGAYASKDKQGNQKNNQGQQRGAGAPGGGLEAPVTTVSPTFQQAFTPQFAPALVQQQSSPGAVAAPVTTMVATSEQRAAGGGTTLPAPYAPTLPPSMAYPPARDFMPRTTDRVYSDIFKKETPFDIKRYLPETLPRVELPIQKKAEIDWVPIVLIGGGLAVAAIAFFGAQRTPAAGKV